MRPVNLDIRQLAAALATTGFLAVAACGDDESDDGADADRQAEIAERGSEVMPFDLDATMHRFEPTDDGLVQTVVADDPDDDEQIELIREHLYEEADLFAAGDLGDPASIHGHDMPGLAELEAGAGSIEITPETLPDGARITYRTDDRELVAALHSWAAAQVADHGDHAEHVAS